MCVSAAVFEEVLLISVHASRCQHGTSQAPAVPPLELDLPIPLLDMDLRATPDELWEALWGSDAAGLMRLHAQLGDHSLSVAPWVWKGDSSWREGRGDGGGDIIFLLQMCSLNV